MQPQIPRKYLHCQRIGCSERGIRWLLCLLQARHQRLDVLRVIHFNRQGTGIELYCHAPGSALPPRLQKGGDRFPADPPDFHHRL